MAESTGPSAGCVMGAEAFLRHEGNGKPTQFVMPPGMLNAIAKSSFGPYGELQLS